MPILPRLHLFEIADQPWCPDKAIEYVQLCLTHSWNLRIPLLTKTSPAAVACEVITQNLPDLSSFTLVDLCSGAGGPTTTFESLLNTQLHDLGRPPIQFLLTDLNPRIGAWAALSKDQDNIAYISESVDATQCGRLAPRDRKECRMFNLSFHHFDDSLAVPMLRSAIESADAFIIIELAARDFSSTLILPLLFLIPFQYTMLRFRQSPLHLFFTYLLPFFPLLMLFDGWVSMMRCRTPDELHDLVRRSNAADMKNWEFRSGKSAVMYPVAYVHWFMGVKKTAQ
ncbi:hypothetical protein CBS63078_3493 [Aspergillus niger]|uniref:Eukaryotic aspartyl protease family protein n=2 Tax=Aspergillus niger TaxID=5061 RepID=A0A505HKV9_ASPNG|nr:uncharacterized protein BO96DRAFT_394834 [Aspergillus niger CBS 101883]KAI2906299.1 hypothetical protein CBS13152_483 [Aspergillus niger]KAI2915027.1 hypothetical protein CBS63078_3493 [Aspergillus niger]KAI2968244.1 hypothetical protein CBS147323_4436 [Aspergillus niger]KAI3013595.1 hypothetical protein CBS147345_5679 [Aspergillus niger]KAI3032795.1 hypothetical protein CBS147347_1264 [Aspergillus niger]